jgi:8-hydroxy-5-deazaflavin:NADPH oxidoreductase
MNLGVIGAGDLGANLVTKLAKLGLQVSVANKRGPESLQELVKTTDVKADSVMEVARGVELAWNMD